MKSKCFITSSYVGELEEKERIINEKEQKIGLKEKIKKWQEEKLKKGK